MRKLLAVLVFSLCVSGLFAQEDNTAIGYRNDGVKSYKAKEYAKALVAFEKSLELATDDPDVYYNAGLSAQKIKDYDKAIKYYDKTIELKHKGTKPYGKKAKVLQKQKKMDEAKATLLVGIEAYPNKGTNLKKMLGNQIYNQTVKVLMAAAPLAKSDPDKYKLALEESKKGFEEARPYLEAAYKKTDKKASKKIEKLVSTLKTIYKNIGVPEKDIDAKIAALKN